MKDYLLHRHRLKENNQFPKRSYLKRTEQWTLTKTHVNKKYYKTSSYQSRSLFGKKTSFIPVSPPFHKSLPIRVILRDQQTFSTGSHTARVRSTTVQNCDPSKRSRKLYNLGKTHLDQFCMKTRRYERAGWTALPMIHLNRVRFNVNEPTVHIWTHWVVLQMATDLPISLKTVATSA